MEVYAGFELPNGSRHIRLPLSVDMLQELGVADGAADFESKVYDCGVTCGESDIYVPISDGSSIEDFNRAGRVLSEVSELLGKAAKELYWHAYSTPTFSLDKLRELPNLVKKVNNATTYVDLAKSYVEQGKYGDLPRDILRSLDYDALGCLIRDQLGAVVTNYGVYEIKR